MLPFLSHPELLPLSKTSVQLMVILIKPAGSLSLHDGDVHENGNKAISLDCQNNNSARASRFFLNISLPSLNDYGVKIRNFKFCGGREDKTMTFFS